MAKKRWSGFSEAERKAEMEKVRAKIHLTKKQRVERARKASAAAALARQERASTAKDVGKGQVKKGSRPKGGMGIP